MNMNVFEKYYLDERRNYYRVAVNSFLKNLDWYYRVKDANNGQFAEILLQNIFPAYVHSMQEFEGLGKTIVGMQVNLNGEEIFNQILETFQTTSDELGVYHPICSQIS